jgi:hypothetical protein
MKNCFFQMGPVVIRLHGSDRLEIEQRTKNSWNEFVEPKDDGLQELKGMLWR